jgi:nicotinamide-nucleotide amidase
MSAAEPPVPDDRALENLARRVGAELAARGWHAATAESCTGGWIAKAITDVPGASNWFDLGIVTYSDAAKAAELGVAAELIRAHGAVSEAVVAAMAAGAKARAGIDIALAVSGVAGPGGGSAEKPVGTVWFAWAFPEGLVTERRVFGGDRDGVRRRTVAHALGGLLACIAA